MKKYLKISVVLVMVMFLAVSGCALFQTVCHPTAAQQATVQQYKAQAEILLAFLSTQVQDDSVQSAIRGLRFSISVYDQVLAGVCMAVDVVAAADNQVTANQTVARKKLGYRH